MASNTNSVTVTTTATLIAGRNSKRKILELTNNGLNTVYIGLSDTDCTVASSFPLESGDVMEWTFKRDEVWGITSSGTSDVRVLEEE